MSASTSNYAASGKARYTLHDGDDTVVS